MTAVVLDLQLWELNIFSKFFLANKNFCSPLLSEQKSRLMLAEQSPPTERLRTLLQAPPGLSKYLRTKYLVLTIHPVLTPCEREAARHELSVLSSTGSL